MIEAIANINNYSDFQNKEVKRRENAHGDMHDKAERKADNENAEMHDKDDAKEAVKKINDTAEILNRKIHIDIEKDLNLAVVKVIDKETEKVVRQIPPEEVVELSKNAKDMKGLLIDKEG